MNYLLKIPYSIKRRRATRPVPDRNLDVDRVSPKVNSWVCVAGRPASAASKSGTSAEIWRAERHRAAVLGIRCGSGVSCRRLRSPFRSSRVTGDEKPTIRDRAKVAGDGRMLSAGKATAAGSSVLATAAAAPFQLSEIFHLPIMCAGDRFLEPRVRNRWNCADFRALDMRGKHPAEYSLLFGMTSHVDDSLSSDFCASSTTGRVQGSR